MVVESTFDNGLWIAAFVLASIVAIVGTISTSSKGKLLPPGPRHGFWDAKAVGSSLPPCKQFAALHKQYGPVVSFYQGKTPVVVLGTIKAATDLLEKKGKIFSSRPRKVVAGEILSQDMRGIAMPYGPRWRNWRSLMHAGMGLEASHHYKALQSLESQILLRDLLMDKDTGRYASHLRRFAVSIAICVSYGRRVKSLDDPVVVAHQNTEDSYVKYLGAHHIVDSWPILLQLPRFLQWFRRGPERQREIDTNLYVSLMEDVRRQMALGNIHHSTAKRGLEKQADFGLNDVEIAYALSAPLTAGVGTTLSAIDVFILAMLNYPETMKKAQAEIDAVIGSSRLPDFEDADSLPYISALIKETLRWRPIVPTAIPHSATEDYMYQDKMYIPAGSTVFANLYSMSKIEEMFPSPEEFKPERYLEEDQGISSGSIPHPTFFFGFGRRICPGMNVANNSLFMVITRILWAFNINAPQDANGKPVIPSADDFVGILVSRPRSLNYLLEFRRDSAGRELLLEECRRAEEKTSNWT